MKKSSLGMIGSVLFIIIVVASFYSIWSKSNNPGKSSVKTVVNTYAPVDISGMKAQAVSIISEYENNSGIPIPTPTEKMGKVNPFTDPE